jgi:peptide/nickel transport system permease protein
MIRFITRRLALLAYTMLVASVLIFVVTYVIPGNVGRIMLGPFAGQQAVDTLNAQLGLDQPVVLRYLHWIGGLARGDWGRSFSFEVPVLPLIAERYVRSILLALVSLALLAPAGIALGMIAARVQGRPFDRAVSLLGLVLGSIPEFVTGVGLIVIFGITLGWLPTQALAPEHAGLGTRILYLAMPAACLMLLLFTYLFRMMRASTIAALRSDYVRTATLKGLPEWLVLRRHVLRNAILPTITVIGAQLGWMIGGLVVVETLFRYPGIGSLIQFAGTHRDVPLLAGCTMVVAATFAAGSFLADTCQFLLDPRQRAND